MSAPDYFVCLDCETPCYDFEWEMDNLKEILCAVCGNEDMDRFLTPDEVDALEGDDR